MKKLHISFKLSIIALIAAFIAGFIAFAQLLSIYSIVGSNESNQKLENVSMTSRFTFVVIILLVVCHIACLTWGFIHEIRKK